MCLSWNILLLYPLSLRKIYVTSMVEFSTLLELRGEVCLSNKKSCMKTYLSHHNVKMLWPLPNKKIETIWMFFYDKHKSLLLAKLCYPVRQQQPSYCSIHKIKFISHYFLHPAHRHWAPLWEYRRMRMKLTWDFHKQIFEQLSPKFQLMAANMKWKFAHQIWQQQKLFSPK